MKSVLFFFCFYLSVGCRPNENNNLKKRFFGNSESLTRKTLDQKVQYQLALDISSSKLERNYAIGQLFLVFDKYCWKLYLLKWYNSWSRTTFNLFFLGFLFIYLFFLFSELGRLHYGCVESRSPFEFVYLSI